jgi:hypothetical protein
MKVGAMGETFSKKIRKKLPPPRPGREFEGWGPSVAWGVKCLVSKTQGWAVVTMTALIGQSPIEAVLHGAMPRPTDSAALQEQTLSSGTAYTYAAAWPNASLSMRFSSYGEYAGREHTISLGGWGSDGSLGADWDPLQREI